MDAERVSPSALCLRVFGHCAPTCVLRMARLVQVRSLQASGQKVHKWLFMYLFRVRKCTCACLCVCVCVCGHVRAHSYCFCSARACRCLCMYVCGGAQVCACISFARPSTLSLARARSEQCARACMRACLACIHTLVCASMQHE